MRCFWKQILTSPYTSWPCLIVLTILHFAGWLECFIDQSAPRTGIHHKATADLYASARYGSGLPTVVQYSTKGCLLQMSRSWNKLGTLWFNREHNQLLRTRTGGRQFFQSLPAAENNHHSKLSLLVSEVYRAHSSVLRTRMKKWHRKRIESKAPLYCMVWYLLYQALRLELEQNVSGRFIMRRGKN